MFALLLNINEIQSKVIREINDLRGEVEKVEVRANSNYSEIELLKKK